MTEITSKKNSSSSFQSDDNADLAERLAQTEAALEAVLSDKVNAILSDVHETPLLLTQVQNALRENNELFEKIFSSIHIAIAYMDREFNFLRVNQAYARADGRSPEEYVGKNHFALYPNPENQAIFQRVIDTGEPYMVLNKPFEYQDHPERGISYWDWSLQPVKNQNGTVTGLILSLVDVTERTRAILDLDESRRMFEQLFELAPDAILLIGQDMRIEAANQQAEKLFGYTRSEILGRSIEDLIPTRFQEYHFTATSDRQSPASNGMEIELYGRKSNGQEFPIDITLNPTKTRKGTMVISVIRDVTQRKQAEKTLKDQAALLKLLQDVAFAANESTSIESAIQFALDALCSYTGWSVGHAYQLSAKGDIRSMKLWHLKDPDLYASFRKRSENNLPLKGMDMIGEVVATAKPVLRTDLSLQSGFLRAVDAGKVGLKGAFAFPVLMGRTVVGVLEFFCENDQMPDGEILDAISQVGTLLGRVIERSQARQNLQRSEARFRTVFEESGLGIKVIDLQGHILDSNDALAQMLGYSTEEMHGKSFTDLTDPRDLRETLAKFQDLLKGEYDHFKIEKRYIRKDGKILWGHLTMSLVRDTNGKPQYAIGMVEDINRRKEIEAELTEVQRRLMESTEAERLNLAQELHDGPIQDLYGVSFQLQQLDSDLQGHPNQETVNEIRSSIQSVISILRYTCGELRPPTLAPFGLEKAIRSHAEHFQESHPELTVQLDLMRDGQLLSEQTRLALYRNYQQLVSNVVRHAEATQLMIRLKVDDQYVTLDVEDNGCGFHLPDRWIELARSGHLGLVGASERAEALGGHIEVKSKPGGGTLIRTIVPIT